MHGAGLHVPNAGNKAAVPLQSGAEHACTAQYSGFPSWVYSWLAYRCTIASLLAFGRPGQSTHLSDVPTLIMQEAQTYAKYVT